MLTGHNVLSRIQGCPAARNHQNIDRSFAQPCMQEPTKYMIMQFFCATMQEPIKYMHLLHNHAGTIKIYALCRPFAQPCRNQHKYMHYAGLLRTHAGTIKIYVYAGLLRNHEVTITIYASLLCKHARTIKIYAFCRSFAQPCRNQQNILYEGNFFATMQEPFKWGQSISQPIRNHKRCGRSFLCVKKLSRSSPLITDHFSTGRSLGHLCRFPYPYGSLASSASHLSLTKIVLLVL